MPPQPRRRPATAGATLVVALLLGLAMPAAASAQTQADAPCQVICVIGKNVCQIDSPVRPLVNQIACLIGGVLIFIDSEIPLGT